MASTPRSSRSRPTPSPSHHFDAIGTRWQIDTAAELDAACIAAIADRAERYDRAWSRFRDDSLVQRMSSEPGAYRLPAEAVELFRVYRALYEATDGAMSPLVGRALEDWGYDRAYSLRAAASIRPVPRWKDAIAWDGETLDVATPVVLDVGAAGKGQLVDLLAGVLADHGVGGFTVDGSGDLLHTSSTPLRVALEHPLDRSKAIGVATVTSGALCASATNRRSWPVPGGTAHHVIDAITGIPTRRMIATWVTASTALEADALATALFFVEPERLREWFEFECVRMSPDGRVQSSPGFPARMFT